MKNEIYEEYNRNDNMCHAILNGVKIYSNKDHTNVAAFISNLKRAEAREPARPEKIRGEIPMSQKFNLMIEIQQASNDDPAKGYLVKSEHDLHVSIVGRKEESTDQFNFSFFADDAGDLLEIWDGISKKYRDMVRKYIDDEIRKCREKRGIDLAYCKGEDQRKK